MVNKLTYYQYKVPKSCVQKSQMGYSRKNPNRSWGGGGGVEDIELSAIIACQVPASYQPLAANKPLLALFSLFTNAITQLAAGYSYSQLPTVTLLAGQLATANDDYIKSINQAKERNKRPSGELTNIASYLALASCSQHQRLLLCLATSIRVQLQYVHKQRLLCLVTFANFLYL